MVSLLGHLLVSTLGFHHFARQLWVLSLFRNFGYFSVCYIRELTIVLRYSNDLSCGRFIRNKRYLKIFNICLITRETDSSKQKNMYVCIPPRCRYSECIQDGSVKKLCFSLDIPTQIGQASCELIFQLGREHIFTNIQPKVLYASCFPRDISFNLGASLRNQSLT